MSPVGEGLRQAVQDAVRAVRRDAVIALAAMVAGLIPLTLLVIWALGPTGWSVRGPGPLAVWGGLAIAGGALVALLLRRWVRGVDEGVVAAEAERGRGLPEGSLRGVLELGADLPPGGSAALFRRSESEMAGALAGSSARDMAGRVGERARRRRSTVLAGAVALAVVTAVAAFVTPERARGSWAPLLSPVAHLNGPTLPPVTVLPGDAEVERGGSLELDVEAPYRRSVTIQWRATGDVPRSRAVATEAGRATASLGPVSSPLRYWVTAPDGATSDTFTVHPVDPLLATDLQVEVVYPPHVGREVEVYAGEAPALRVPEGTQLRVRGGATRPLAGAVLRREDGRTQAAAVSDAGFALDWRPDVEDSGFWLLELEGSGQSAVSPALDLVVVADAPPTVRITVPEAVDTTLAASRRQPVMADAADDHGLRSAALVYRPVAAGGREGDERAIPLRVEPGADRLLLRGILDVAAESLVPGDAIHYQVVVRDNSPAGQVGASAVHVLRLPGLAQLRDQVREDAGEATAAAERLAERTADLETATRNMSRRASGRRSGQAGSGTGESSESTELSYDEASEARQLLEDHEAVRGEAAALRDQLEALKRAMEDAGLTDAELERRLAEIQALYQDLAGPERQARLDEMREALDQLDPEALREALEQLAGDQEELRRRMEEAAERLRRAAAEQELEALTRDAEEIAAQQDALAQAMREETDPGERPEPRGEPPVDADSLGDDPQTGDPQTGEPQTGDPQTGDPQTGDPQTGDPQTGDPQTGDPQAGEPQAGEPQAGEPQAGEPQVGDPQAGDPQPGDPSEPTPELPRPTPPPRPSAEASSDGSSGDESRSESSSEGQQGQQGQQGQSGQDGREGQDGGGEEQGGGQEGRGQDGQGGEAGQRGAPSSDAGGVPSSDRAAQQESLARRAGELNQAVQAVRRDLQEMGESEAAEQASSAGRSGESAQESMESAASSARREDGEGAASSGERAAEEMAEAARTLEAARTGMREGRQQRTEEAVRQSTQEALSLAEREEALRRQMEQAQQQGGADGEMMAQMREEQTALRQGLEQLGRNLSQANRESGLVSPDVSRSLSRASRSMDRALEGMQGGGRMPVQEAGEAVESLNRLAMSLLENQGQAGQQAGAGMNQALEQLADLAREQASVNSQSGALSPMDLSEGALEERLDQLGRRQRVIARRVGDVSGMVSGQEALLGRLDALSSEAEAVAEALEAGRLDPEVRARQEQLFNRLLDAGRSLEREEYSDDRRGEAPGAFDTVAPEALDPALLDPALRYPVPSAERLRDLPPSYRRLILEYFDRLNRSDP